MILTDWILESGPWLYAFGVNYSDGKQAERSERRGRTRWDLGEAGGGQEPGVNPRADFLFSS